MSFIREWQVEYVPLHTERSQLRCFRHLIRMAPGCLLGEMIQVSPAGRRLGRDPGHAGWNMFLCCFTSLLWCPHRQADELEEVAWEREV